MSESAVESKRCHRLADVVTDAHVEAEFPHLFHPWWCRLSAEERARALENECNEFVEFLRDHRSQDAVHLEVVRVKKDLCSNCKCEWEVWEDEGKPVCAGCGAEVEEVNDVH